MLSAHDDVLANHITAHSIGCRCLERQSVLMLLLVPLTALGTKRVPRQSASCRRGRSRLATSAAIHRAVTLLARVQTQVEEIGR